MRFGRVWVTLLIVGLAAAAAARAQGSTALQDSDVQQRRPDYDRAIEFFHRLQAALRRNDAAAVATMVHYPLRAEVRHREMMIRNKASFLRNYGEIFTVERTAGIVSCKDVDVWWRDQGYSIPGGLIWFDGFRPPGKQWPDTDSPEFWKVEKFGIETVNQADAEAK